MLQPDFGTAINLAIISVVLLFVSGVSIDVYDRFGTIECANVLSFNISG